MDVESTFFNGYLQEEIFPLLLVLFPGICKHSMKSIGKQLIQYFDMSEVYFNLGYITVQGESFIGWFL
jgi:hypothetical protein